MRDREPTERRCTRSSAPMAQGPQPPHGLPCASQPASQCDAAARCRRVDGAWTARGRRAVRIAAGVAKGLRSRSGTLRLQRHVRMEQGPRSLHFSEALLKGVLQRTTNRSQRDPASLAARACARARLVASRDAGQEREPGSKRRAEGRVHRNERLQHFLGVAASMHPAEKPREKHRAHARLRVGAACRGRRRACAAWDGGRVQRGKVRRGEQQRAAAVGRVYEEGVALLPRIRWCVASSSGNICSGS